MLNTNFVCPFLGNSQHFLRPCAKLIKIFQRNFFGFGVLKQFGTTCQVPICFLKNHSTLIFKLYLSNQLVQYWVYQQLRNLAALNEQFLMLLTIFLAWPIVITIIFQVDPSPRASWGASTWPSSSTLPVSPGLLWPLCWSIGESSNNKTNYSLCVLFLLHTNLRALGGKSNDKGVKRNLVKSDRKTEKLTKC